MNNGLVVVLALLVISIVLGWKWMVLAPLLVIIGYMLGRMKAFG